MRELQAEIEIAAHPARVWEVLSDLDRYPEWNPYIRWAVGELRAGQRMEIYVQIDHARGIRALVDVLVAEPNREIRWRRQSPLPGVSSVERTITLEPLNGGAQTRVRHQLVLRGLAPGPAEGTLTAVQHAMEQMCAALRDRAEWRGLSDSIDAPQPTEEE